MVRRFVLALLGAAALVAGSGAQQPADNLVMAAGHIGPVKARISEAELKALPFTVEKRTVTFAGSPADEYVVRVDADNTVAATIYYKGKAHVHTTSTGFATAEGARVGASVAELQKLYPKGALLRTGEETGGLNFYPYGLEVRPHLGFEFPVDGLSPECLEITIKACPDLSGRISISAFTS